MTLKAGETFAFSGTLKRLVDTRGWVSADYHNHSTQSGDNTCGTDDRIINLAAEHIEFAPTTEHNRLYDWRPHIDRLGLAQFIQTVPGMELTGSGAHFNSFPFKPVPRTQDNGAPVWNKDPRITAITLRDWQGAEPDRWVQINHPDMVTNFIDARRRRTRGRRLPRARDAHRRRRDAELRRERNPRRAARSRSAGTRRPGRKA